MSKYRIEARLVCKDYRIGQTKLEVLKNINLSAEEGEFVAIQGPSGAGKSTLLHILGALDEPTQGEVLFGSRNVYDMSGNERAALRNRSVGFVFQFYHLLPELDVLENVLLPAMLGNWWQRGKVSLYAKELLERAGLSSRLRHRPSELSGGEQQRVAICRALINKPRLVLCDEPTGNLDSENGEKILGLLKEIHASQQMTVLMVTHDREIASSADRVVHLKDGVIIG